MKFNRLLKKDQTLLFFRDGMFIGLYTSNEDVVFQIERVGSAIDMTINHHGFMGIWVHSYQVKDENNVIIETVDYKELPPYKGEVMEEE